jgi:hypothetical protein
MDGLLVHFVVFSIGIRSEDFLVIMGVVFRMLFVSVELNDESDDAD